MLINKNEVTLLTGASPSAEPLVIKYREENSNEKLRVTEHFDESGNFTGINIFFPCKIWIKDNVERNSKSLNEFIAGVHSTITATYAITEGEKTFTVTPFLSLITNADELFEDDIVMYVINWSELGDRASKIASFVNRLGGKKIYTNFNKAQTTTIAHEIGHLLGLVHVENMVEILKSESRYKDADLIENKFSKCNLMREAKDSGYNICLKKDIKPHIVQYITSLKLFQNNKLLKDDNKYNFIVDTPSNMNIQRGLGQVLLTNINESLDFFNFN
jgi:hypothetical protein